MKKAFFIWGLSLFWFCQNGRANSSNYRILEGFVVRNFEYLNRVSGNQPTADLWRIDHYAKQAKVLALGESEHGIYEPAKLRNRIFKYLVKKFDYRLMMLESGFLESRLVDQFIKSKPIKGFNPTSGQLSASELKQQELNYVLSHGVTHGMGHYQETEELLLWMRRHNEGSSKAEQLSFIGPDLTIIGDSPYLALVELNEYFQKFDKKTYQSAWYQRLLVVAKKQSEVSLKIRELLKAKYGKEQEIDPDLLDGFASIGFDQLSSSEINQLEQGLDKLEQYFIVDKAILLRRGLSLDDYNWFSTLPVFAKQMLRNLHSRRQYPKITFIEKNHKYLKLAGLYDQLKIVDYSTDLDNKKHLEIYFKGRESRERALAEMVAKAQASYGPTMIFAHNLHLLKGPTKLKLGSLDLGISKTKNEGQYLKDILQDDYRLIITSMGEYSDSGTVTSVQNCKNCLEKSFLSFTDLSRPIYLDLSLANNFERKVLQEFWQHRNQNDFQLLQPAASYDALIYFHKMKHGTPL